MNYQNERLLDIIAETRKALTTSTDVDAAILTNELDKAANHIKEVETEAQKTYDSYKKVQIKVHQHFIKEIEGKISAQKWDEALEIIKKLNESIGRPGW